MRPFNTYPWYPPAMSNRIILPQSTQRMDQISYPEASSESQARLSAWLRSKANYMRSIWMQPPAAIGAGCLASADALIQVLLHHNFNHQSKGRLAHLLPALRSHLEPQIWSGCRIPLFLLYNGGYRASPFPASLEPIFEPDQTEFMLLLQITRLQEKMSAVYAPGIEFVIVINNGVARWVNDIATDITQAYVVQLREMIQSLGASAAVSVLLQSELNSFTDALSWTPRPLLQVLSDKEHRIVERFLGRPCSAQEAQHRSALYVHAEATWAQLLQPIATLKGAAVLRQVAHPHMLSFRPFPGGAIRSQNGSVGFEETNETQVPKLITSENFKRFNIELAHINCASIAAVSNPSQTSIAC